MNRLPNQVHKPIDAKKQVPINTLEAGRFQSTGKDKISMSLSKPTRTGCPGREEVAL